MPTQIAEAYVQIKPSAKGIKNELKAQMGGDIESAGNEAGESFGSSMVGKLKGILAAAGIGAIIKQTLDAGGALQQSFGGLDTLYEEASGAAKQYAREAAAAGISMNDYAEQAVSFGASLKSAFEGDVGAAAEAANTAILDMADNAAKMGTPLESIQNAYQGFAKGQYNMLDNLKLGYGGTKTEMERLLKDAEKISGVKYNMDNLGDVYEAIHVIQGELGLTGVAAAEASETFTGSFEAMKATATNLMADIATGNTDAIYDDIQALFQSVETFVFNNLVPMLKNIIGRLPQLLANLVYEVGTVLENIASNSDEIVDFALTLIVNLVNALVQDLPYLVSGVFTLLGGLVTSLLNYDWASLGTSLINNFKASIADASYYLLGEDNSIIDALINWFTTSLPAMVEQGINLVLSLVEGIGTALPTLIESAVPLIVEFIAKIGENLPAIIAKGFELVSKLIAGIIKAIPLLVQSALTLIKTLVAEFGKYDWKQIGIDILTGIKNGIISAIKTVVEAAKEAASAIFDAVKGFFDIGSPSKLMADEIGHWIPSGIAVGIEGNMDSLNRAVDDMNNQMLASPLNSIELAPSLGQIANSSNDMEALTRAIQNNPTQVNVVLEGDAKRLFKAMQSEATNFNTLTGRNAFA
ncbi:MAG: hypothetical protein KBT06_05150 [Prevotellaceae bacterium]|nr:hypothetical protein [Candidatus Colivivens equi]